MSAPADVGANYESFATLLNLGAQRMLLRR